MSAARKKLGVPVYRSGPIIRRVRNNCARASSRPQDNRKYHWQPPQGSCPTKLCTKAARGPATAPRAVPTSGELPRVGYRRPAHDEAPAYSLQSMARTLRDTGLAPATIRLNLYWAAATRRRTNSFASRQFLYFRNELPTHLNFTASFRNELLTLRDPISIAPICTVLVQASRGDSPRPIARA